MMMESVLLTLGVTFIGVRFEEVNNLEPVTTTLEPSAISLELCKISREVTCFDVSDVVIESSAVSFQVCKMSV